MARTDPRHLHAGHDPQVIRDSIVDTIRRLTTTEQPGSSVAQGDAVYQLRRRTHPVPGWYEVSKADYEALKNMPGHEDRILYTTPPPAPAAEHCPKCNFTMSGVGRCVNCEQPEARGVMAEAESLARRFHTFYECLAPSFGYETRTETRQFNPATPNGRLMIAVCSELLRVGLAADPEPVRVDEADNGNHKLDTDAQVFFYEQDFYVLSNFSAFTLEWRGLRFDTSEAAYHWEKFHNWPHIQEQIAAAPSAHEAFKLAAMHKNKQPGDWDFIKLDVMRDILRVKASQNEYVRRKLLATGTRELVEDSWRDDFWGWGPNRNGQNWLGRLWMEVRAELVALAGEKAGGA